MIPKKYSCGNLLPSSCVPFSGADLTFKIDGTVVEMECTDNLDDVVGYIDDAITTLQENTDVSLITASCITFTTPRTVKTVLQDYGTKLCATSASLAALTTQVNSLDIGSELVTLNLGSLAAAAAPCLVSTNTYSLISVLQLFANEIIAIKTELGI